MIKLGDRVKDTVTGFEGIAVAKTEWLHGCVRFVVQPQSLDKDGKVQVAETFDEPQLKIIKAAAVAGAVDSEKPRSYGPRNDKAANCR
jgi:hypothetical protein